MDVLRFLLKIPLYLFFFKSGRRLLATVILIIVLAILYHNLGPQSFEMSPIQKRIGNELVEKAVAEFPWSRDVGSVLLIADIEEWSPFFQDSIRSRVKNYKTDGSRKFDICPDSFAARVIKTLGFKNNIGRALPDKAIRRIVEAMDADTLLLVRFTSGDYIEDEKNASGRLSCTFYIKKTFEPIRINVSAEQKKSMGVLSSIAYYFRPMSASHKLVWGILGVILFPFLMAPITLTVASAQSAKANGFMIFVYAIVIFIFEGIMFSAPSGTFQALLMSAWGVIIVWYLLRTCDLLASPGFKQRMQLRNTLNS